MLAVKAGEPLEDQGPTPRRCSTKSRATTSASQPLDQKPYWHVERARIGDTRKVPVELIVNGQSVETQEIEADGNVQRPDVRLHAQALELGRRPRSSPAAHTNPVFVEVDGKPIRASQQAAPSGASTRSMSAGTQKRKASARPSAKPPQPPTTKPAKPTARSSRKLLK